HPPGLTRELPPFPTRRSSDLDAGAGEATAGVSRVDVDDGAAGHGHATGRERANRESAAECALWIGDEIHRRAGTGDVEGGVTPRSEEHTSELQSLTNLVCRLL